MREAWRSFLDEQSVATGSPESWSFFARSFFSYGKRSRFTDGKMGRKIAGRVCPPTVLCICSSKKSASQPLFD